MSKEKRLANQVAVVTGGASGIGEAICKLLFAQGADVVIVDLDQARGKELEKALNHSSPSGSPRALFIACDVTNSDSLKAAIKSAISFRGRLNILCNNAGIDNEKGRFPFSLEPAQWKKVVAINLTSVIEGTQIGCDLMARSKGGNGGVIINTASMGGLLPIPDAPVYAATKAGVVNFTRSLAHLGKWEGVRVNAVCPTFTDTPLIRSSGEQVVEGMKQMVGGLLSAKEVAQGVLDLILDESKCGAIMRITVRGGKDYWPKRVGHKDDAPPLLTSASNNKKAKL